MDRDKEFYIVLPSNSSAIFYPENTTTCYTTHLSREIRLSGDWVVGLAEIHIPSTFVHIEQRENFCTFPIDKESPQADISKAARYSFFPHGVYNNLEELASKVNTAMESEHHALVPSTTVQGHYALRCTDGCMPVLYCLSKKLHSIFGFEDPDPDVTACLYTPADPGGWDAEGCRPACLEQAIPDQLYVYTDICTPYAVGDTQASLLRIISFPNTPYKFGSNIVKYFSPIHYIPLLHYTFDSIVIDIRDKLGERLPFAHGTVTVTLHFKRLR